MSKIVAAVRDSLGDELDVTTERVISIGAGVLLILPVLKGRSTGRWLAAAAGGVLIYKGASNSLNVTDRFRTKAAASGPKSLRQSVTIGKDAETLSRLWRDPDALSRVMQPFGHVRPIETNRLSWTINLPTGPLQAEAELVEERPGELVHWRSTPARLIRIDEFMRFRPAPQGQGTEATLEYHISTDPGLVGKSVRIAASLFDGLERGIIRKILHNLKSLAETGEIPTLERNPSGRANNNRKGDLL